MIELPDLKALSDAGGWAAFAGLAVAILFAFITGKIHGQGELDREIALRKAAEDRADKAAKSQADLTATLRDSNSSLGKMAQSLEFLEDFVRDIIRDQLAPAAGRGRPRNTGTGR